MKRFLGCLLVAVAMAGCGINKQAQQIKALERCKYRVSSAEQITVAGADVKKMLKNGDIDLAGLPGLAFGLLRKDVPLRAKLNLEVTNPSGNDAAINEFEYKILINNQELANGLVNQEVNIAAGGSTIVPVDMQVNIYPFISNNKVMSELTDFIKSSKGGPEKKGLLTIKIKPSIKVAGALVKYPGYITIDKEVSSKILL